MAKTRSASGARTDEDGRAFAGSQMQVQSWINDRPDELSQAVATALGTVTNPASIEWRAPLRSAGFAEPMDAGFLEAVGLGEHADALASFWPASGPRWDALAVVRNLGGQDGALLVEGKSYPEELVGGGLAAKAEQSIRMIANALGWTKGVLGADPASDWLGSYYQYANRLAHVCFLRERLGVPTWLVNLCFIDDPHRPTTRSDWEAELPSLGQRLGFRMGYVPYSANVLLPAIAR